ncbi:MAG: hypothetical protein JWM50_1199 [Microbacteriaceae bacterium]|jgi:hypothetical protein|nr:hypothetical protein [Microbacteriaceae bacterium]
MSVIRRAMAQRIPSTRGDDGAALVSALLFMILLSGMSFVLLAIVLGQIGPSYAAQKSTKTVYGAQAGLQAALGVVRSATGTAVDANNVPYGDLSKLPCSFGGNVDGAPGETAYAVTIGYYITDPTGKDDAWLASNDLACGASGVTQQPFFAYIVSKGTGTASPGRPATEGNRSVAAVYDFKITNVNIPGGRIYSGTECMEADKAQLGSEISFKPAGSCASNGAKKDDTQLWVYDKTYQIKLASTIEDGKPGLCITGIPGELATLQTCVTGQYNQLWSWDGSQTWWGQKAAITTGYSNARLRDDGKNLAVSTTGTPFTPEPSVGSAAAGESTKQIVNYKEFGRCADVTDQLIGSSFMISYPCKQDPSSTGAFLNWNHKWFYTEAVGTAAVVYDQEIYVLVNNATTGKRCLQAPVLSGKYVTFAPCTSNANQKWDRTKKTDTYANSYLFIDNLGRCLTADAADTYKTWSKLTVSQCTPSEAQKWNAPSLADDAKFGSFKEIG